MSRAFTLTELLVASAIIAIVSACLFPVLAQAKSAGNDAVCVENLRQIGFASRLYSQDYDDLIAYGPSPYLAFASRQGWDDSAYGRLPDTRQLWAAYHLASRQWRCGQDKIEPSARPSWPADTYFDATGSSYWVDGDAGEAGLSWTSIPSASATVYVHDLTAHHSTGLADTGSITYLAFDLHTSRCAMVAVDQLKRPELMQ